MNAALLIDAENFSYKHVQMLFENLKDNKDLQMHLKVAFGDWTLPNLNNDNWKTTLNKLSIRPQHLFNYTKGKNASDIQLVIHAMNILHTNHDIDTFILATNDSDFTPLVLNLKEYNKKVIGYGSGNCSKSLHDACDNYVILKEEKPIKKIKPKEAVKEKELPKQCNKKESADEDPTGKKAFNILKEIWKQSDSDEYGWVTTNQASKISKKAVQDFSPSKYGCSTLSELIQKSEKFEIRREKKEKHTEVFFKLKDRLSDKTLIQIYNIFFKNHDKITEILDKNGDSSNGWLSIDLLFNEYKLKGFTSFKSIEELKEALSCSNLIYLNKEKDLFTIKMNKIKRKIGFLFFEACINKEIETGRKEFDMSELLVEVKKIEEDFTASRYQIRQLSKFIQSIFFIETTQKDDHLLFKLKYKI